MELIDLYTYITGYISPRTSGNQGGDFLIAGPGWEGTIPEGIKMVFHSLTEILLALYRTQLFSPEEISKVHALQDQYQVRTLSQYLGTQSPHPAPVFLNVSPIDVRRQSESLNTEFQHDMLETIGNTVNKMKGLMQRLKAVPEKKKLESAVTDLSIIAKSAVQELNGVSGDANIRQTGVSAVARVDREEIKNVIVNLILNAFDATKGKGMIEVESGVENGVCYIRVKDDGCGMERKFIDNHLFKPFRTTKKKGLGIGLYQCRQIVAAHGGRIEVES